MAGDRSGCGTKRAPRRAANASSQSDAAVDLLPKGADRARARAAIEEALRQYHKGSPPRSSDVTKYERWQRVAEIVASKSFTKLVQSVGQVILDRLDRDDPEWLSRLAADLVRLKQRAAARAEFYRPRTQLEHLIARLLDIWRDAGGRLSISQAGPLPRFLLAVLPQKRSGKTIQRLIEREKKRRLIIEQQVLAGAGNVSIDESKVLVVTRDS